MHRAQIQQVVRQWTSGAALRAERRPHQPNGFPAFCQSSHTLSGWKMARRPADEFVPSGYVQGMASAQMGNHWNDPSEPQYSGQPFTKTMIYGTYDGALIFTEPMVSKAYLETKPSRALSPIKLPAQYSTPGYQATSYSVAYDAGTKEYLVALSGLVLR